MALELLKGFAMSFLATLGFGVLLHAPKRALIIASLIGALGYICYWLLSYFGMSADTALLIGAMGASLLAEFFARRMGMAVTVFSTLSIIPLVPGLSLYRAMSYLAQGESGLGAKMGIDAMIQILMIALGMAIGSFIFRMIKSVLKPRHEKRA